jgi:hypothetical protein
MKSTGKIYCLRSKQQPNAIYIGSTEQKLTTRFNNHKSAYKQWMAGKRRYVTSFELCKFSDCRIESIDDNPENETNDELVKIERSYIQQYMRDGWDVVNKALKHDISVSQTTDKKEYQRELYNLTKDRILEQQKQYKKDNAEKIKARASQKIECECGSTFRRDAIARHRRSAKHQNYINQQTTALEFKNLDIKEIVIRVRKKQEVEAEPEVKPKKQIFEKCTKEPKVQFQCTESSSSEFSSSEFLSD